jgi:hypothetical protein
LTRKGQRHGLRSLLETGRAKQNPNSHDGVCLFSRARRSSSAPAVGFRIAASKWRLLDRLPPTLSAMCLRVLILSDKLLPESIRTRGCSVGPVRLAPAWKALSPTLTHGAEFTIGGCGCALIPSIAHRRPAGRGAESSPCLLLGEVLGRTLVDGRRLQLLVAWAGRESDAPIALGDITVDAVAEGRLPLSDCVLGPPLTVRVVGAARKAREPVAGR